jgi:methylmalonyl-CoA mutase
MGLQGMINDMLQQTDYITTKAITNELQEIPKKEVKSIAAAITVAENDPEGAQKFVDELKKLSEGKNIPVLGITGTGGSGKSSLVDELVRRFLIEVKDKTMAIISVDPSKRKTGGALLGDRIRMNAINNPRIYMRSLATRQANLALSKKCTGEYRHL